MNFFIGCAGTVGEQMVNEDVPQRQVPSLDPADAGGSVNLVCFSSALGYNVPQLNRVSYLNFQLICFERQRGGFRYGFPLHQLCKTSRARIHQAAFLEGTSSCRKAFLSREQSAHQMHAAIIREGVGQ
jgi:hypothetical protein